LDTFLGLISANLIREMVVEMKKLLLAGVAGVAFAGAPANAADLSTRPTYKAPPVVAPVPLFTWTGCYIGGHIGGGWGHKDWSDVPPTDNIDLTDSRTVGDNVSGIIGGGQIGCNYQFAPNWVVGIEGSGSASGIKGDATDTFFNNKNLHAQTDWLASVTGRVGWTFWNRWMVYGKGGVAWAGDKYHVFDATDGFAFDASGTRTGWTAGGGIEWAFAPNWSAFLEYDFYGFGGHDVSFSVPPQRGGTFDAHITQDINVVKVGINYLFNWR
jgi:outer membrane immunogenic protein